MESGDTGKAQWWIKEAVGEGAKGSAHPVGADQSSTSPRLEGQVTFWQEP